MNRPKLILLVGIPGSGKSTYAHKYIKEHLGTVHLSSDGICKELHGDESIQDNPGEVFTIMQKRAIDGLNFGYDVIYDATNVTRKDRTSIITACPKFAKIECNIIWAPIETCIERDAAREHTVGKAVIDKMLKRFQAPYYDEGIDEIKLLWNTKKDFNQHVYVDNLMREADIDHDNPHHTLNIKEHCEEAYRYALAHRYPSNLSFAVRYHDIGKPYVKAFIDSKGNPCDTAHYYQHNCVGAWMAYGFCLYSVDFAWLVSVHMDPFLNTKYYNKLPAYLKKQVDLLHEADRNAH